MGRNIDSKSLEQLNKLYYFHRPVRGKSRGSSGWLSGREDISINYMTIKASSSYDNSNNNNGDDKNNCNWRAWNRPQVFGKVTERDGIWRKHRDHPNYSIVEISQSTKKSPGNLRRLVTQTSVKDHQLTLMWKSEMHKLLWDFEIETDNLISARRPNPLTVNNNKEREGGGTKRIVDFTRSGRPQSKIKRNAKER